MACQNVPQPTQMADCVSVHADLNHAQPCRRSGARSKFHPDTKIKSFSTSTQNPSQFRSLHWNQGKFDHPHWNPVNFNHQHKTLYNSINHTIIKLISTHHWSQVNFHTHSKFKLILMPRQKKVYFNLDTKTTSFSAPTQKTSCRYLHWNEVECDPPYLKRQVAFNHPQKNKGEFNARTKSMWFSA